MPRRETPLASSCLYPFSELSVCWNGAVYLCCNDWAKEYFVGSLLFQSPAEVWGGLPFEHARDALCQNSRPFAPCRACDISYSEELARTMPDVEVEVDRRSGELLKKRAR